MTLTPTPARVSVVRLVVVIFLSRVILNIAYRAVYPFLPVIATDLGVSVQSAAQIIQSRNLVGLAAPLFGPLSDHYGRRRVMSLGVAISVVASLLLGVFTSFAFTMIAVGLITVAKILYDPAQQAYLGDRVPYVRRGRVMSLSETSWAAAALIGLPVFGLIVQYANWRTAFVAIGVVSVLMFLLTFAGLPDEIEARDGTNSTRWRERFTQIARTPGAVPLLITSMLITASNENVNVMFGVWMKDSFLLDAVALGSVASAIGFAELGGELFSSGFVDRIGKYRLVRAVFLLTSGAYFALPAFGANAFLGTVGLMLVFFLFELAIVSMLPFISELVPTARATLISLSFASALLGRAVGSFTGPLLYVNADFTINGIASGIGMVFAFGVWHLFVRERFDLKAG